MVNFLATHSKTFYYITFFCHRVAVLRAYDVYIMFIVHEVALVVEKKGKGKKMSYCLVGINRKAKWNFSDPVSGERKSGFNQRLYVLEDTPMSGEDAVGSRVDIFKVSKDFPTEHLEIGQHYNIAFNKFGNIEEIYTVKVK